MSYFDRHLFICANARHDACKQSCNDNDEATTAIDFIRGNAKKMGLIGPGKLRITQTGCLGRCESGPLMVIYPEGRWYTYVDEEDLQDILDQDLVQGQAVERLLIDPPETENE
ncbi:(2Fe-2S) ferredoxin domain-containing protein [Neisseria montereyensis]|uniref:(2Fe-2S) ferredoxin domain-containing protein n=1 Tax=Neisseria montereyensis TaxID=2973938 RepID=A0ABT2FC45_9NEIS|nr:(2Fe-2S) ferredoxin domain-containing protein [Neisseria montereyensis]MCS4533717.1 (2Fe-2S) ferredoxin domain-containing protein [Neisseria montereyensis]